MPEITITAKRDGFRRCGVAHRDVPVTWPDGHFTDEEIAILRAEPSLVVHIGALSGDDDKLKTALGRLKEQETISLQLAFEASDMKNKLESTEAALAEMTADRDRLQEALTAAGSASVSETKENATDVTAAAESSAKAKK
ncbi:HI1506-related protein [Raoultella ornithinolytica]|uniref:HI1506-related protein n=1 Tax=Raoultella ornithinolytica TaxID=54291 RepID=UPI00398353DA